MITLALQSDRCLIAAACRRLIVAGGTWISNDQQGIGCVMKTDCYDLLTKLSTGLQHGA